MKCERCRFAPPSDAEGFSDECYHFETNGVVWKDGSYGCTLHYQTLAAEERRYLNYLSDMGTDMGIEEEYRVKGWNMDATVNNCKHMLGMDRGSRFLHRHGKVYYSAYRNYWCNNGDKLDFDLLCSFGVMEKSQRREYVYYYLTDEGLRWLGNKLGLVISVRN